MTTGDPTTDDVLARVAARGYRVSVHAPDGSPLGPVPAVVGMHAVQADSGEQHVVTVPADEPDAAYRCACGLAESVGIDPGG